MHGPAAPDQPRTRAPAALRIGFTTLIALAEAAHLAWEHLHGGIVSHHLLNDPSLPALWNGWGLLVLPSLAWFASSRAFDRTGGRWRLHGPFALRLLSGVLAGLALSMAFSFGREDIAGAVLVGLLASALVVRLYRIECLLGFVLGMAFTFGALLPTLIGGFIALLSAAACFGAWPLVGWAWAKTRA
ncbi:hypothetical protein [Cognatilysobacter bugurensis]|uniref:Uncharacterized protein n=1 Tax=Cognatilysobacter bugurensis TaxID=543356 RepID=A0A918SZD9_9GAMM|nr:hypothetical protein [Lysobacter bugurensis]GHA78923.1 hypothetical protein GCM10007067_15430 [Lysobacter bugurensis]